MPARLSSRLISVLFIDDRVAAVFPDDHRSAIPIVDSRAGGKTDRAPDDRANRPAYDSAYGSTANETGDLGIIVIRIGGG